MVATRSGAEGVAAGAQPLWRLHRLAFPRESPPPYALSHGLFPLAAQRPDLYRLSSLVLPGLDDPSALRRLALVIRAYGELPFLLAELLRQPAVAALLEAGVPLILDNSTEAGFTTPEAWADFRSLLEAVGLRRLRLLVLQQQADSVAACSACFADHPAVRAEAVVFHHWLHRSVMAFRAASWPAYERARRLHPPQLRLLCLNGRLRSHRALVVGWLRARQLLEESLVSLQKLPPASATAVDPHRGPEPQSFLHRCQAEFPGWEKELEAYRGGMATALRLDGDVRLHGDAGGSLLLHHHCRTRFSLVTETEMSAGGVLRFTEKCLRPLACFHPLLVAGNPGTLALLREHGFRTFSPWIDERYDQEPDPPRRLALVLAELERWLRMPEQAFSEMLIALEPILQHNHSNFRTGLELRMEQQHRGLGRALERLVGRG